MAGQLYRALIKNQNLQPLVDNIKEYVRKKRQEENLKKLMELISGTQRGIGNIYNPPPPKTSQPSLSPEQTGIVEPTRFNVNKPKSLADLTKQKPRLGNLSPQIQSEQEFRNLLPQSEQYTKEGTTETTTQTPEQPSLFSQNKEANLRMLGFLRKLMSLEEVSPEMQQQGLNIVQGTMKAYQPPTKERVSLGYGGKIYEYDPESQTYKLVADNPKEMANKPGSIYERVETFNVNGKPVKRGLRKDTQQWEDLGEAYYKPNITNINMRETKSEKWKDFSEKLTEYQNPIYIDQGGNLRKLTPEEIKARKDALLNSGYNTMLPGAYRWYNKYIKKGYGRENISHDAFLREVEEALTNDEISADEAQDLLDFDAYRDDLFEGISEPSANEKK